LQQSIQDKNTLNERIRLYFKKGQKDFDEFDSILLQISMHYMQGGAQATTASIATEIERFEEIQKVFVHRARQKEFPAIKYLIYL
jgi:anaerobic ribonucleoside-triphosphate reductase